MRKWNRISCIAGRFFTNWAVGEAQHCLSWTWKVREVGIGGISRNKSHHIPRQVTTWSSQVFKGSQGWLEPRGRKSDYVEMRLEIKTGICQVLVLNVFLRNNGNSLWDWLGAVVSWPWIWVVWRMGRKVLSLVLLYMICIWGSFLGSSSMFSFTSSASPLTPLRAWKQTYCGSGELEKYPGCDFWGEPSASTISWHPAPCSGLCQPFTFFPTTSCIKCFLVSRLVLSSTMSWEELGFGAFFLNQERKITVSDSVCKRKPQDPELLLRQAPSSERKTNLSGVIQRGWNPLYQTPPAFPLFQVKLFQEVLGQRKQHTGRETEKEVKQGWIQVEGVQTKS